MDKIALNFVGKSTVFLLLLEPPRYISPHFSQNEEYEFSAGDPILVE